MYYTLYFTIIPIFIKYTLQFVYLRKGRYLMESNITFWNPWWLDKNYNFEIKERVLYPLLEKYI